MPVPSVTYTFVNGTKADAGQVNTNFSDLVNGLTDGNHDLTIKNLICENITSTGSATYTNTTSSPYFGVGISSFDTWGATYVALQIGGLGALYAQDGEVAGYETGLVRNSYYNLAGSWVYIIADEAERIRLKDGAITYYVASAGAAAGDAVTWVTVAEMTSSGLTMSKPILLGTQVINNDGTASRGLSFDANNLATIQAANGGAALTIKNSTGKYLDMGDGTNTLISATTESSVGQLGILNASGQNVVLGHGTDGLKLARGANITLSGGGAFTGSTAKAAIGIKNDGTLPTATADVAWLYCKDDGSSKAHLYTMDEDGNEVELGSGSAPTYGDDTKLAFGDDGTSDSYIEWTTTGTDHLKIHSSSTIEFAAGTSVEFTNNSIQTVGVEWTVLTTEDKRYYGLAYGNGVYVAIGYNGNGSYSYNTESWSSAMGLNGSAYYNNVGFGGGVFIAVGYNTVDCIAKSTDGASWDQITRPSNDLWWDVAYSPTLGRFVIVAYGIGGTCNTYNFAYSDDGGTTWIGLNIDSLKSIVGVCWGDGQFVAVNGGTDAYTSPDGINWTKRTSPSGSMNSVSYGNGLYVAPGDQNLQTSPDGITWTSRTVPEPTQYYDRAAYGNGVWVMTSNNATQKIVTSLDGITWTGRDHPTGGSVKPEGVSYANGRFLIYNQDGGSYTDRIWASGDITVEESGSNIYLSGLYVRASRAYYGSADTSSIDDDDTNMTIDFDVNGAGSKFVAFESNGTESARVDDNGITLPSAKSVDCATNGGYFKPRRVSQSAEPTPDTGELLVWRDTDDDKTYLVFEDGDVGTRKIELT